ncbi:MAG: tryptophan synthase subunit alpha [Spirochaetia bacterium]|nr:tryptophan synthase subunit alpha [Spirochaetia bacterium]
MSTNALKKICSLENFLIEKKKNQKYLFIPYIALSFPDYNLSFDIVSTLLEAGADTIELGLPFTDPIADGPVLQKVFTKILEKPFRKDDMFLFLEKLNAAFPDQPFLLMGYANMFLQSGFSSFTKKLYQKNIRGIIAPDLPYHEKIHIAKENKTDIFSEDMAWIDFITPATKPERLKKICQSAKGFIYVVSTKGVTGQKEFNLDSLRPMFQSMRKITNTPLMVGFGVRTKENAVQAIKYADGFIVGTKINEIILENLNQLSGIPNKIKLMLKELLPEK